MGRLCIKPGMQTPCIKRECYWTTLYHCISKYLSLSALSCFELLDSSERNVGPEYFSISEKLA
jgi:hypothetical protein